MDNSLTCKILNKNNIDIVLYHGSCSDGFGSAFVIWYYFKQTKGLEYANAIKYIPCYYQKNIDLPEDFLKDMFGKNILMCDFSYKYNQLIQIINIAQSFMILDHHKTAENDLAKIPSDLKIFDMDRSGCGITWDFFYPDVSIPKFLSHIQDRDIWTHRVPKTSEFVTYFYEQDFDFELWETYLKEETVEKAIQIGEQWLEYQKILIEKIINKASCMIQEIDNKYAVVLYSNCPELKSDIGNKVFNKYPIGDFSCVWNFDIYKNQTACSLRSTNDRMDVSKIATRFGGGGHRNASGCSFSGATACLPFELVDDCDIIGLLLNGTTFDNALQSSKNTETKLSYALFKVREIRSEWLEEKYLNLIKRKYNSSDLIVFEKESHMVDYDGEKNEVIPLKEYTLYYNEQSGKELEKQLQIMVCGIRDQAITFTSSKDFDKIFGTIH